MLIFFSQLLVNIQNNSFSCTELDTSYDVICTMSIMSIDLLKMLFNAAIFMTIMLGGEVIS